LVLVEDEEDEEEQQLRLAGVSPLRGATVSAASAVSPRGENSLFGAGEQWKKRRKGRFGVAR
jgi:hypothetical protein